MARPATFTRDPVIRWIDEADKFRRFLVEQRIASHRIGRGWPAARKTWQNMRTIAQLNIGRISKRQFSVGQYGFGIAAVAIGTAQNNRLRFVHRPRIGCTMARYAT